jgi:transcriptional regulator with XRE-family HTH domain
MKILEFHRRQARLSQTEFAGICGITQAAVSDIELGKRPTEAQARSLERALSVPAEELLKELPEDIVPPPPSLQLAILSRRRR